MSDVLVYDIMGIAYDAEFETETVTKDVIYVDNIEKFGRVIGAKLTGIEGEIVYLKGGHMVAHKCTLDGKEMIQYVVFID